MTLALGRAIAEEPCTHVARTHITKSASILIRSSISSPAPATPLSGTDGRHARVLPIRSIRISSETIGRH
jgi:hypothetical protein